MHFSYARAADVGQVTSSGCRHTSELRDSGDGGTDLLAGGTDLLQLVREGVRRTDRVLDLAGLDALRGVSLHQDRVHLGTLTTMADAAAHPLVREHLPVVSQALLASASPQVRNRATLGGNLLQRTRCGYFRDVGAPCNKRVPGSGCPAAAGQNRLHAVLGTSPDCLATYAGDLANALLVLDATVDVVGPHGPRTIPLADLHLQPGRTPHVETQLAEGELLVGVTVPLSAAGRRSSYLKVRDRASFEWAVASAAVALELGADGVVADVRVAVGGVATTPWRLSSVEGALLGRRLDRELCRTAAASAADGAVTHGRNAYKTVLLRRTVERALATAAGWPA